MAVRPITRLHAVVAALLLAVTPRASGGPYGDALGKCLIESITAPERTTLMRWVFATVALHPELEGVSAVTPAQRAALSKEAAQLYQRLLTETCRAQTREAIRHEGLSTIPASFAPVSALAAQGLFGDPKVTEGLSEPVNYFDEEKFRDLVAPSGRQ